MEALHEMALQCEYIVHVHVYALLTCTCVCLSVCPFSGAVDTTNATWGGSTIVSETEASTLDNTQELADHDKGAGSEGKPFSLLPFLSPTHTLPSLLLHVHV